MPYVWIAVMIGAVIGEAMTPGMLVSIWFLLPAFLSMILAFCSVPLYLQFPIFIVLSLISLFFFRPLVIRRNKTTATNIDSIIGEKAVVVEKIENIAGCGQVKVNGLSWSARSVRDEDVHEPGEVVTVIAVEGVKLICKK